MMLSATAANTNETLAGTCTDRDAGMLGAWKSINWMPLSNPRAVNFRLKEPPISPIAMHVRKLQLPCPAT